MLPRGFASGEIIHTLVDGGFNQLGIPRIHMCVVDVREVALAHMNALKIEEAANQRFILSNQSIYCRELADPLAAEFNQKGWVIQNEEMGYCKISVAACFNEQAR